jgi:hypothetical protein
MNDYTLNCLVYEFLTSSLPSHLQSVVHRTDYGTSIRRNYKESMSIEVHRAHIAINRRYAWHPVNTLLSIDIADPRSFEQTLAAVLEYANGIDSQSSS